jgi:hypothetical protein
MRMQWRWIGMIVAAMTLCACGGVHHRVTPKAQDLPALKQIVVLPVEVNSKEQTPEAQALNEQWKKIAADELRTLLDARGIAAAAGGDFTVGCFVNVVYGNRALRYMVGFGAGAGHMSVAIELKNRQGTVLFATTSEADLAAGAFGGDMAGVARSTILEAVKKFGEGL